MIPREKIKKAPQTPGVYYFCRKRAPLYVGKAQNLRARLLSYFSGTLAPIKKKMVAQTTDIAWKELSSPIAALIEEARMIKRHQPRFNVLLRDDKNYFFAAITKEAYPRIFITHQTKTRKLKQPVFVLIGPFTDGNALKSVLRMLRRIFPFCTCTQTHQRMCARAEIGLCPGVCCVDEKITREIFGNWRERQAQYKRNIRAIRNILSGKHVALLSRLKREMVWASKKEQFEKAIMLRSKIAALQNIFAHRAPLARDIEADRQKALFQLKTLLKLPSPPQRIEAYDISHTSGKEAAGSLVVFVDGLPGREAYRRFRVRAAGPDDTAMMQEVLTRRFRHNEWPTPDLIIVDGGKPQLGAALAALHKSGKRIPIAALAKREEELYIPGRRNPFALKTLPPSLLHLAQHIRDEAHRFAISYHKLRRKKSLLENMKERGTRRAAI